VRLFVAVELPDEMRRAVRAASDELRQRLGSRIKARWLPTENLHITVRFIGNVPDERSDAIVHGAGAPLDLDPFQIRLGGCGAFPPSGAPRVIWMAVADGAAPLAAIHREMNRRLERFGFEPERRAYSAHLTLARVKDVARGTTAAVRKAIIASPCVSPGCRVSHATIFRSVLSPAGARYEPLARVSFLYP
jgi:2'-5' RNA ligase